MIAPCGRQGACLAPSHSGGPHIRNIDRRAFLIGTGGSLALPLRSLAQQTGRTYRVGLIQIATRNVADPYSESLLAGLREHGYVVGRNLVFDVRHADGDPSRLPALVDELLALKPDVVACFEATARVIKGKSTAVPIVLTTSSDPVGLGLAPSLARFRGFRASACSWIRPLPE